MVYANYFTKRKLKILVWNECYVAGGADWSLIDLITHWPASSDLFVLYVNKTHEGLELLKDKMPPTVEVRLFDSLLEVHEKISRYPIFKNIIIKKIILLLLIPLNYFIYKKEISSEKYDALLMNNGGYPGGVTNFLVSLAAKSLLIQERVMIVRNYPAYYSKDNWLMKASDWIANRTLDRMITVSQSLKKEIINKTNIDNKFIDVIYNGVSIDNMLSNDILLREANYVKDLSVGIIGTLQERKGHQFLFRSWVKVLKKFPDARLYVVASAVSGDKDKLIAIAKNLKIEQSIKWIEFTKNVGDIYQQLNVVVMPSLEYESFGRIIVEAMAFSVPIIATKVGGMPELIDHDKDGFLVEKYDEEDLANCIIKILDDPESTKQMVKAAYQKYMNFYTADVMARSYYALFKHLN